MNTNTTTPTTHYAMYHIEWWNNKTGQEVLMGVLNAGREYFSADGCHVYTPDVLTLRADQYGEMDLVFSVAVSDMDAYCKGADAVRNAGYRVKTACYLDDRADIARGTSEQMWSYFDHDVLGME